MPLEQSAAAREQRAATALLALAESKMHFERAVSVEQLPKVALGYSTVAAT